ncbi:glycosyltransferase [Latilactobacillus sakei]|uniref:glycosyltransferase n=1 Tax=Latilactobacillus sakei TaxID=1599 RepID=UPI0013A6DB82|nr:glycosyltransferase [Latilactobacillus sakei]
MSNEVGAIIVTFNPDISGLKRNINAIYKQVDRVVIVDNGSNNLDSIKELLQTLRINIDIIDLGKNLGIAAAQNRAISSLDDLGFSWVVTLDQDSEMADESIQKLKVTSQYGDKDTGILAAQYNDSKWTEEQRKNKLDERYDKVVQKKMVIASGNLVNIKAWKAVQGYDEWMFIDQVDFDFNAKLLLAGYKIWQVNNVVMDHAVGDVIQKPMLSRVLLFPKKAIFSDHSAFREYYIQRNTIIYSKRYPEFRRHKYQVIVSMIQSRRILVYSEPRIKKLISAWKGIIDGVKYRPEDDTNFMEFRQSLNNRRTKNEN